MRGRRPFRLGLWLGVLLALVWFIQRQRQRDAAPVAGAGGPTPLRSNPPTPVPPVVRPEVVEVGAVEEPGEPPVETVEVPEPVEPAPALAAEPVVEEAAPAAQKRARKKAASTPKKAAKAAKKKAPARKPAAWVVPEPGGICPPSHPVKAKLLSGLFHLPGMFAYNRTKPDRCYRDEAAAEADGLRRAKR